MTIRRVRREHTTMFFDPLAEPVIEVASGEPIVVETADSLCGLVKQAAPRGFAIDDDREAARLDLGHRTARIPVRPFLGTVGVAPPAERPTGTWLSGCPDSTVSASRQRICCSVKSAGSGWGT